jgi:hypothetical protein
MSSVDIYVLGAQNALLRRVVFEVDPTQIV